MNSEPSHAEQLRAYLRTPQPPPLTPAEAEQALQRFRERYPAVQSYLDKVHAQLRATPFASRIMLELMQANASAGPLQHRPDVREANLNPVIPPPLAPSASAPVPKFLTAGGVCPKCKGKGSMPCPAGGFDTVCDQCDGKAHPSYLRTAFGQ